MKFSKGKSTEDREYHVRCPGRWKAMKVKGSGIYFRTRDDGGLIIFDRNGLSLLQRPPGMWKSIKDVTDRTFSMGAETG